MAEAAGLALGVITAWTTCVQVFDIVSAGKQYGMDFEILRVKLEVERIRLLAWGSAVGLGNNHPDYRLDDKGIRDTILGLLGCIEHVFSNSEKLQKRYGLRQEAGSASRNLTSSQQDREARTLMIPVFRQAYANLPPDENDETALQQSQSSSTKNVSLIKRAYAGLRRSARDRQRSTPFAQKTLWAIHDKAKFQLMITEIKGFNDSLVSLFPGWTDKANQTLRDDIDASDDIRSLLLLEEAAADAHGDMSETASVRLEALGATASAQSVISADAQTLTERNAPKQPVVVSHEDMNTFPGAIEPKEEELEREMDAVENFMSEKENGALTCSLFGPQSYSARVTSFVHWTGEDSETGSPYWNDRDKGFVTMPHASFELYRRKKFLKKVKKDTYSTDTDEDYVYFDIESSSKYENKRPGTVTIEGFALECWDYEELFGKQKDKTYLVSRAKMPEVKAKKLLRRVDELRRNVDRFGWSPDQDDLYLQEFVGDLGIVYYDAKYAKDPTRRISDLYSVLNRDDVFVNFTTTSSVALEWAGPADQGIGLWNLLWQIIVAKELTRRLEVYPDASISGLTAHGLASLIIADLWLNHLEVVMTDARLSSTGLKKADTPEEQQRADDYKEQGNRALAAKKFQQAVDLYTKAMEIDLTNPIYRTNRAVALLSLGNNTGARDDASVARQLDPRYAKAWHWLGACCLKMDNSKEALYAYQRALDLTGSNASVAMKQGFADAKAKRESEYQAIEKESSPARKHSLRMKIFEEDWDIDHKHAEFHSLVHERQIEGLLLFAERMKWPYVNEVRDYAEDVYANLRSGKSIQFHLHDWVFGLTLPGKWMAFKIMTALILCTPSITAQVGIARFYECGLVLPQKSYWRARTVLARVLGCLPNVISLCGWIGPCPAVEFQPSLTSEPQPMHIRLKARRVAPIKSASEAEDNVIHIGGADRYEATRIGPDEEIPAYIADIQDYSHWAIPEPPVRDLSTCTLQAVRLKKMPLDMHATERSADGGLVDETNSEVEYRASLVFKLDNHAQQITYTLYTNPVFVTLPPCHAGPEGPHEVHLRELPRFQKNLWSVGDLREHVADTTDVHEEEGGGVMIINATGNGCEILARAWCAERGRNAVIRRTGGPCFVCAYRAASRTSLGVGVLIWVS